MQAIFQRLLIQNQKILSKVKQKVKEEGNKGVLKLKNKLPTQDELMDKFTNNVCTQATINKSEKNYNKFKNIINGIKKALEGAKKALEALRDLLQKVLDIIAKITALIAGIAALIAILNIVVNIAKVLIKGVGMLPGTISFPAGPLILADKAATAASGVINILKAAAKSFKKALERPLSIATQLMAIVAAAIAALSLVLNLINMLIQMLETLFLNLLNNCSTSNPGGNNDNSSGTNTGGATQNILNGQTPEEFLADMGYPGYVNDNIPLEEKDPFDYSDPLSSLYEAILQNLKDQGHNEIIEKIYNAKFQMVGYNRFGVMGSPGRPSFTENFDDRRADD